MAEPTADDIRNACKYAEAKLQEELGFNEYNFLPKKFATFRRHPTPTYPCPFGDSKLCPTGGRYVFTRAGCEEMSCNPYGPGGLTLSRANRGSFGKYCYLDEISLPSYFGDSSPPPSNQTGEEESASAIEKSAPPTSPKASPPADGSDTNSPPRGAANAKKANDDEGEAGAVDDDDGEDEDESPSQPASTPLKKKKKTKKNKKKKRGKAGDAPNTHIHAWARLPGATDYGCYVASPYVYATAHVMGLGVTYPSIAAPKSARDEYEKVFRWYNESGKIPHGMPLLHYTKDYCEKKVYVSYDADSMQCYRPPGQYVAEEAFMGKLYREILVSVRGTM